MKHERKLIGGVKMMPKMNVVPWDPKALKQEVVRIVRSFGVKESAVHSVKSEQVMPTMHVTPWDRKAMRMEVLRIVSTFKEQTHFLN
jgi:hypothetical protein